MGKITNKFLRELGESLGLSLNSLPKHLQGKVRLAPETVHPDIRTRTEPLRRMFHGSNDPEPFGRPIGDLHDLGLHLADSPDVASYYALGSGVPPTADKLAGPRVYPMLVDPGKVLQFPGDAGASGWDDPRNIMEVLDMMDSPDPKIMNDIYGEMQKGRPFGQTVKDMGYDSVEYYHGNPFTPGWGDASGMMLFDPRRALPEFSPEAQDAARIRGVLAGQPSENMTAEQMLFELSAEENTPDDFLRRLWNANRGSVF